MRAKRRLKCPILIEANGNTSPSELFASAHEMPEHITMKVREGGWKPYRAKFDESQSVWIVAAIDWHPTLKRASR
jgi:hypothetical protein